MFHRQITGSLAAPVDDAGAVDGMISLFSVLEHLAVAAGDNVALQQGFPAFPTQSLAERYAAANPIARRRFDAVLHEAETTARIGMRVIVGRLGRDDRSTPAAARFLGKSVAASLRKLDALIAPPPA